MTRRHVIEPPARDWWIVEVPELGVMAAPSRALAHQAAEVVKGAPYRYQVARIRPAMPTMLPEDAMAIEASEKEIAECGMDLLVTSGALNHQHRSERDLNRIISHA